MGRAGIPAYDSAQQLHSTLHLQLSCQRNEDVVFSHTVMACYGVAINIIVPNHYGLVAFVEVCMEINTYPTKLVINLIFLAATKEDQRDKAIP